MNIGSIFSKKNNSQIIEDIKILSGNADKKTLAIWSADCAERVLPIFEEKYPEDPRPRKAIESLRSWIRGEINLTLARTAALEAHAAARAAEEGPARSAARAAGQACSTAHSSRHAAATSLYAASCREGEREWQYKHLIQLVEDRKN